MRFEASTGDAVSMTMMFKRIEDVLVWMKNAGFHDMRLLSLSDNYCIDKTAVAIVWIDERDKRVLAQATTSEETLKMLLNVQVDSMVAPNSSKNLVGNCLAS